MWSVQPSEWLSIHQQDIKQKVYTARQVSICEWGKSVKMILTNHKKKKQFSDYCRMFICEKVLTILYVCMDKNNTISRDVGNVISF